MNNLFVYLEICEGRHVAEVSLELLSKGRSLANQLNCRLEAVAIGCALDPIPSQVMPYGVDVLHLFDDAAFCPYTSLPHAAVLTKLFSEEQPQIVLMGATANGRDLAPRVSSALQTGLTADCIALDIGEYDDPNTGEHYDNILLQILPSFGGNVVATIVSPSHRPQMATVREGVMRRDIIDTLYQGKVVRHDASAYITDSDCVVRVIQHHVGELEHHLKEASIVVAGGYGVGSRANFQLLFDLAKELHAEVGATRAAVDAGLISPNRMIGQTGLTVRPKLYIACGISGQIQHIAGMQESAIIISINSDPHAPINAIADYVILGRVEDVVPKMISSYKKNSK